MFGITSIAELGKALVRQWYIFVIIGLGAMIWWYRSSNQSLEKDLQGLEAELLTKKYRISELEGTLKGKEKELAFKDKQMVLLEKLKEKERIIENHYHERVVENNTTIQKFEENKNDWTPILEQIDSYFGFKPTPTE